MKIAIIANCQTQAISNYMRIISGCSEIVNVPAHLLGSEQYCKALTKLKDLVNDGSAIIFTFNLGERFGEIATQKIKATAKAKVFTITNLFFAGFHPDITYLGSMGKRILSPLGDYHSKIVLNSFTSGFSEEETIALFNEKTYKDLGFFEEYNKSKNELLARDKFSDIQFGEEFLQLVSSKPSLYTMNHPTPDVLYKFTCRLCEHAGITYSEFPPDFFNNYLSNAAWWPVYKEIAEYHKVNVSLPMIFKQPDSRGGNVLSLTQFVVRSYMRYNEVGTETIKEAFITNR
ncbi:hypothetical protein FJN14_15650 [Alteromonas mediterranea]|uniref:WcbI family polysaccharide biosynthesis putative acetyltransferase n=1 Tax=Alteromonas mediterranea TaxID=314275 RepID=UPI0011316FEC|nr:WcbI family polysaccharide biosynthesis putative acetyltransferase [Alteromonas mediterranea]QDG39807.1 hypothetical protein FJN14_15650 [Alteromonas mediterranea]